MSQTSELILENAYLDRVRARLWADIVSDRAFAADHDASIRVILNEAWDELRLRPTAISPMELEQLATDVDRFTARRAFAEEMAERAARMLKRPFFARVDFRESGEAAAEKVVIGMFSLRGEDGNLLVYDWRAPISGLYYDSLPGPAHYESPSGEINGEMTLKRQYRYEGERLKYFVDTREHIDDSLLLDVLSAASSRHMREIVATIQAEQNAAIRAMDARVVCVAGGAGSGKTSVAMHRAAYLMYRQRDKLDAGRLLILSPSTAFSEYIANVLPELGEKNIRSNTLHALVEAALERRVETSVDQLDALLKESGSLRLRSVAWKGDRAAFERLRRFAQRLAEEGPAFEDVLMDDQVLLSGGDLTRMYQSELKQLTPKQRLERLRATLESFLQSQVGRLALEIEPTIHERVSLREKRRLAMERAEEKLAPVREALLSQLSPGAEALLDTFMLEAPNDLLRAWRDNQQAGLLWWEDAVAMAYLRVKLGFASPDKHIAHLLIDEAQDYTESELALLHALFPRASVTILGDPRQRTCPALPPCAPGDWGRCFGEAQAPVYPLTRCYRSSEPIARFCAALLAQDETFEPVGRPGAQVETAVYTPEKLKNTLQAYRQEGEGSIAILTRTPEEAVMLSENLERVYRLDGGREDLNYEEQDNIVACYHLAKGMEFDRVIVVWPQIELDEGERRRLYTACSRALHRLTLLAEEALICDLGAKT